MLTYILLIFIIYYLIYIIIHVIAFIRYIPCRTHNTEKISVIVPFRNEESNLLPLLMSLEKQTDNNYEVIFIDDHSSDNGYNILLQNITKENFKLLKLPPNNIGKKTAISYGIKHSNGEIILTIDADCIAPENWVSSMRKYFCKNTGMVLGPVKK